MWPTFVSLCLALSRMTVRKAPLRRRPAFRRPLLETLEDRALPSAVYMVTTAVDNGDNTNPTAGSLRDAINQVNAGLFDEIDFNVTAGSGYNPSTGLATFTPPIPLPQIDRSVFINGYTQGAGTPLTAGKNDLAVGDDAVLKIQLCATPYLWETHL